MRRVEVAVGREHHDDEPPTTATGNGSGRSRSTASKNNPTALLVEWAACMRRHGDPDQTDPKIDNHFGIKKIGAPAWWINGWGPPGDISVTSGPQGHPPPGAPPGNHAPTTIRGASAAG